MLFEHFVLDHLVVDRVEFVVGSKKDRAGLKLASISHGHSMAGGIDRPGLAAKTARTWVNRGHSVMPELCPLYPRKRTCAVH